MSEHCGKYTVKTTAGLYKYGICFIIISLDYMNNKEGTLITEFRFWMYICCGQGFRSLCMKSMFLQ